MKAKMEIFSLAQTEALAKAFSEVLKPPMIVLLVGDLGSGKTTFVKSVAKALGCDELVTSPTFTLHNTYEGKFKIHHFDMYRLSSAEEARAAGFAEFFDKRTLDGVVFVEWPENVEGLFGKVDFVVEISKISDRRREFVIREAKGL